MSGTPLRETLQLIEGVDGWREKSEREHRAMLDSIRRHAAHAEEPHNKWRASSRAFHANALEEGL